jgi:hypothetical protein
VKADDSGGSGEDDRGVELPTATAPNRLDQRDARERELGHGKLHCSSPRPLSTFYMDNMIETHNYELVGTLDQA